MSFSAKYAGSCAYGDRIKPGDYCVYTDDDEIAHVGCAAEDKAPDMTPAEVCPDCHLEHVGECF